MSRRNMILSAFAGLLLILLIVIGLFASGWVQEFALNKAREVTGRSVAIGDVAIDWGWPVTHVTVTDMTLGNIESGSGPEMLSLPQLDVAINGKGVFQRELLFEDIVLDRPKLLLEKDADGNANWNFGDNPAAAAGLDTVTPEDRTDIPAIGRLLVKQGNLIYRDPAKKTHIDLKTETLESKSQSGDDGALSIDGTGDYLGHAFTLKMTGGTIFQLQDNSKPYPLDTTIVIGDTRAHVKGTVQDPVQMKGLDIALTLSGKNAAELFDVAGIALPPTPPYDVTGQLDFADGVWNFDKFKGKMGSSDLTGTLTWDTSRKRPLLSGHLLSQRLDLKDLGGFVGAPTPATEKGRAAEQQKLAEKQASSPYVIPDTPLDISRLKAMDAKVSFIGKRLISNNLPLDDFELNVDLDDSLLQLKPLRFGTANGDIIANMQVNARTTPVKISGDFDFKRLQLKPIFAPLAAKFSEPNVTEGAIGGRARLAGTGTSLREMLSNAKGDIGLGMEGGRLSNLIVEALGLDLAEATGFLLSGDEAVPIRCVIGDFAVNRGVMQVRHFVIDTTDSNIRGMGTINLKNEAMDLTLYTKPKDNTIFSLNSPIGVGGTLKDPAINVDVTRVAARSAVGVALGVLFPPAAALAFVETGLGENSPCNALLTDMAKHSGSGKLVPRNTKVLPRKK